MSSTSSELPDSSSPALGVSGAALSKDDALSLLLGQLIERTRGIGGDIDFRATCQLYADLLTLESLSESGAVSNCRGTFLSSSYIVPDQTPGELYQLALQESERFLGGSVYSSAALADFMITKLRLSGDPSTPFLSKTIFDPAVGGGVFLAAAVRSAAKSNRDCASLVEYCSTKLFGGDIDLVAVAFARSAVLLEVLALRPTTQQILQLCAALREHIVVANSLKIFGRSSNHQTELELHFQNDPAPRPYLAPPQHGFDLVIMNPPYGLSRGEKLSKQEVSFLKERFGYALQDKPNKFLAFLALGVELLRPGGRLCAVTPNSWLGIRSARGIRKLLLEQGAIESLDLFGDSLFPGRGVETVVTTFQKGPANSEIEFGHHAALGAAPNGLLRHKLPTSVPLAHPEHLIPTTWSKQHSQFNDFTAANCIKLSHPDSPFIPSIALQAYSLGKGNPPQDKTIVKEHPFHCRVQDQSTIKYLHGKDISRYAITWSGEYLKYGPWLAEFPSHKRFTDPRLVLREILHAGPYCMVSAVTEDAFVYNRSALHIHLRKPNASTELLYALCGIFNSVVGSFIFRAFGRKSQRKLFPKIVNQDLWDFPFPKLLLENSDTLAGLSALVKEAQGYASNGQPEAGQQSQYYLDSLICELYQVRRAEIEAALS